MILDKRKRYLQVALNGSPSQARGIIYNLPSSDRILIEAGTPLIRIYGKKMITMIGAEAPGAYVVADTKCTDLAQREVRTMAEAGASAVTCLGVAPVETIDVFIEECKKAGVDSMLDMMNIDDPVETLKKLKSSPNVVIVHRGVDETEFSKDKQIPYYQINQIKDNFDVMVSVAGGDTIDEIQKATLSGADIVVVWKAFYDEAGDTANLAAEFLKEIR